MDTRGKPVPELQDPKWLTDFAFLVDIAAHLNELNTKLQKREQLIYELYSHIKGFQNKLRLWHTQLLNGNVCHFPSVHQVLGENPSPDLLRTFAKPSGLS